VERHVGGDEIRDEADAPDPATQLGVAAAYEQIAEDAVAGDKYRKLDK
jgi:hypothetical protein